MAFLGFFSKEKIKHTKKKQNHQTTTTTKQTKKTPFCMLANTPLFLVTFCFFKLHSFISAKLCFAENTIKIVFSAEHSFQVSQIVKPLSRPLPKMALLQPKVPFWALPLCLLKPLFLQCLVTLNGHQKKDHFPKTDSCNENARFFYLPNTNSVCLFF